MPSNADMELRRVTVDTEPDWLRVQETMKRAMTSSMDTRLSSLPGGRDGSAAIAARKEVEARIAKIQEAMFAMTTPNLRVNGHDYENFVDATEAWDEPLDRKVTGIYKERVEYQLEVAESRRHKPQMIHRVEEDLDRRQTNAEWLPEELEEEGPHAKAADIPPPPRHQEVVETFDQVVSNLSSLATNVPVQVQRAQRAKTVQQEIEKLR